MIERGLLNDDQLEAGTLPQKQSPCKGGLRFGVWGLGFGVWGLGFGVWGLGIGDWGLGIGVQGTGLTKVDVIPAHAPAASLAGTESSSFLPMKSFCTHKQEQLNRLDPQSLTRAHARSSKGGIGTPKNQY